MIKSALVIPALAATSLLGLLAASAPHARTSPQAVPTIDYAEHLYDDYSAASDQAIVFKLKTVAEGGMTQLEGRTFADIAGEPNYRIQFDETRDGKLVDGSFDSTYLPKERTELDARVDDFDVVGRPYRTGRYRLLSITATLKGETRRHHALEFCWDTSDHCVVFDPQIELMDSTVANHRLAKAQGIGPQVIEEASAIAFVDGKAAQCGLASNRGIKSRTLSWGARRVEYHNIFGFLMVAKNLGAQQVGITCDAACMPQMRTRSAPSTAWANIGYSAACDSGAISGTTGRNGKAVAETRCAHKILGGATARVAAVGGGARVGLAWATTGAVDASGGSIQEACAL